jgi:Raf kinase inhibitor-like YbhB/YbcL family protein
MNAPELQRSWIAASSERKDLIMPFEIKSSAFGQNQAIPKKYTCDGSDISVPLTWIDPPQGTTSFAVIADDPDAPRGTWVHWVIYDVPATARDLSEGIAAREKLDKRQQTGQERLRENWLRWTLSACRSSASVSLQTLCVGSNDRVIHRREQTAVTGCDERTHTGPGRIDWHL